MTRKKEMTDNTDTATAAERLAQLEKDLYEGKTVSAAELASAATSAEAHHASIFDKGKQKRAEKAARAQLLEDRETAIAAFNHDIGPAQINLQDAQDAVSRSARELRAAVRGYNAVVNTARNRFDALGIVYRHIGEVENDEDVTPANAIVWKNTIAGSLTIEGTAYEPKRDVQRLAEDAVRAAL